MRVAWISLNLIGLALLVGGAIYTMNHKSGLVVVGLGAACQIASNYFRAKVYNKL